VVYTKSNKLTHYPTRIIKQQCKKIARPYIKLLLFISSNRSKEDFRKIKKTLFKHYEEFIYEFKRNSEEYRPAFFYEIIIETLFEMMNRNKETARRKNDMLAYSVIMQLQDDMRFYYNAFKVEKMWLRPLNLKS
jgi:hypothetical protein